MSEKCTIGKIVERSNDIKICGAGVPENAWIEVLCNRPDDHSVEGEHWHEGDHFRITWEVKPGTVWLANEPQTEEVNA